ncbi:uncharacterized protein LOC134260338 [Saccostrea cucullata]|uniref:uncharacterized protein LOC134260338 n=1 Tax=Saccostrea cuccullata TaxID=36930 RepID=UPI002ED26EE6
MDSISTSQIKTALQHMSESVFMGLCVKLGTSQVVAIRRDAMDISEMLENQIRTSDDVSMMWSGSLREGFRQEESDADLMSWRNNHRVIWESSQSQYYSTHRQTLILCDSSDSHPGYTLLSLLSPSIYQIIQTACIRINNRVYISSSEYRKTRCSASLPDSIPHGPCASGILETIEYDLADCFVCDFWPPSASSWIGRCHSWPQPHIVDDIVNQKIINNRICDDDKLLCSYHMKTAVFWVIQKNTLQPWCPQNLLECFWVCFKLVVKWVYDGVCPNFFIPQNNMFLSKIHGEAQHKLFMSLYGLYKKGLAFLLHSPSIRSCIINVLHNPRLSICTDEHTLISEAEFDTELLKEIHEYGNVPTWNIHTCMTFLHRIEQMIISPLLTQYQVVMLQKLTAEVLQRTAFILHMEIYLSENKQRYRIDKISCHMLKLAAKFGCISDMSFLAMYYYKTSRYMESLSIIEMIKVKIAQPYVICRYDIDAEMYIEAVGGQSWSTKMRQAVAWQIELDNQIHYISELIPLQMSRLQNRIPILAIRVPPFLLISVLEILCYRHIDTIKAQTALDDLQTLVHYQQAQCIDYYNRDLLKQILGICQ